MKIENYIINNNYKIIKYIIILIKLINYTRISLYLYNSAGM